MRARLVKFLGLECRFVLIAISICVRKSLLGSAGVIWVDSVDGIGTHPEETKRVFTLISAAVC